MGSNGWNWKMDNKTVIYKKLIVKERKHRKKYLWNKRLFNVFVYGLPRSGTSCMTGCLEKLGVNIIHTSEESREKMDKRYKKRLGEYHPNKKGFFEITKEPIEHYFEILSTPYSGCKMIIPVNPKNYRFWVTKFNPCNKVIQMWRDPEEIRQSQQAFYRGDQIDDVEEKIAYYKTSLAQQQVWFREFEIDTMHIQYRNLLNNTKDIITQVAEFINAPKSIGEAVNFVDPSLNRFKKEELAVGI